MSHDELALVRAYMQGELEQQEALAFVDHFETCFECQLATESWKTLDGEFLKVQEGAEEIGDERFVSSVMSRIRKPEDEAVSFGEQLQRFFEGWGMQVAGFAFGMFLIVAQLPMLVDAGSSSDSSLVVAYAAEDDVIEFLGSGKNEFTVLFGKEMSHE